MSNQPQGGTAQPTDSHRGLRLLGLVAVAAGVLLLMAAAFVLSYAGIHVLALSAGVSPRFARIYPGIFDAMLVVACAAVLALRGAGLPSRCYAWLTMLVLLAAAAGADTLHATNAKLPHKPAAAAAAIIPWVLVLLGFGLLLSMLRYARLRKAMLAAESERAFTQPSGHVEVQQQQQRRHGLDDLFGSRSSPDVPEVRYVPPTKVLPAADTAPDLAIESDPGHDDPSSDEGHPAARTGGRQEQPAGYRSNSASAFSAAPTMDLAVDAGAGTARGPVRRGEGGTVPEPRRATSPAAETGPARDAKPAADAIAAAHAIAAAKPDADAMAASETKPTAEARSKAAAEAKPAPKATAEAMPALKATAEAKSTPKTKSAPKTKPVPKAAVTAEPAPQAEPIPENGPTADTGPTADPAPQNAAAAEPAPQNAAAAGPAPETGPGSDPEATAEPVATAEPEPGAGAETAPAVPLQFDRVRSSPVPPEA
jgi:hypothetical protein